MENNKTIRQIIVISLIGGLLSGSVFSVIFAYVIHQDTIEIEQEVKWKEKVLSGLLGPVCMHLDRTNRAFKRWKSKNLYLEAKIIKESNTVIRNLLLTNGHLIPIELLDDSGMLIEHYDVWLEEFEKIRETKKPADINAKFVYAGPAGYHFPEGAAERFKKQCDKYKNMLFGDS